MIETLRLYIIGCMAIALWAMPLPSLRGGGLIGATPEPPQTEKIQTTSDAAAIAPLAHWLEQLGSISYQKRREAFLFLWKQGSGALPAVRQHVRSPNKQVADACSTLELLLRLSVTPEESDQLMPLIELAQGTSAEAVFQLCEKGNWELADEILAGNPQLAKSLAGPYFYHQMNQLVDKAVLQKDASLAWSIIKRLLPRDEALWLIEKQHPDAPLDESLDMESRAKQLYFRGQVDQAMELAQSPGLKLRIAVSSGRWHALNEPQLVQALLGNSSGEPGYQAARAALHMLSGEPEPCQRLLDALYAEIGMGVAQTPDTSSNAPKSDQAFSKIHPSQPDYARLLNSLIVAGQGDQVEAVLVEQKPEGAFSFCLARSHHANALKAVGLEANLGNFDAWLASSISGLQSEGRISKFQRLDTFARVASMLLSLGYDQQAHSLLDQLIAWSRSGKRIDPMRSNDQVDCWNRVATSLSSSQLRSALLKLVSREYDGLNRECREGIFRHLYPDWPQIASALLATAPADAAWEPKRSKWDLMESLWRLDRDAFDPDSHVVLENWFRSALAVLAAEEELNPRHAEEFVALARQMRLPALAIQYAIGKSTGAISWSAAAEISVERGQPEVAARYWKAARQRDPTQHDWLFQEIAALALTAEFEVAQSLERSLAYRPLPPGNLGSSENSYHTLASKFLEQGLLPQALQYARASQLLTLPSSAEYSWAAMLVSDVLEKQKLYLASADALRASVVPALSPDISSESYWQLYFGRYSSVLAAVQKEHVLRAVGSIAKGDIETAKASMQVAEQLQPLGIELVEQCYPALVSAGQQDLANELFARFEKHMLEHLEQWPKDATAHNNLAWMYARCDQKLPMSLAHARIATQLAPDSATLLDTLAEALFRSGQIEAAISAAQKCVHLDRREPHYRQQLSRFRN